MSYYSPRLHVHSLFTIAISPRIAS
jgi:hypothetical protein